MRAVGHAVEAVGGFGQRDEAVGVEIRIDDQRAILGMRRGGIDRQPMQLRADIKIEERAHPRQLILHLLLGQNPLADGTGADCVAIHVEEQRRIGGDILGGEGGGDNNRRAGEESRRGGQTQNGSFHKHKN